MTNIVVSSGITGTVVTVNAGDTISASFDAMATHTVASGSRETVTIFAAGITSSATLLSSGTEHVFSGSQAIGTTPCSAGAEVGSGDPETILPGGIANSSAVGAGGQQEISGDVAIYTIPDFGGLQELHGSIAQPAAPRCSAPGSLLLATFDEAANSTVLQ